ncbi:MAG TPA: aminomethyltransferase family protein [Pyrinomonadaceae bacterium]|jgi:aminomethyltransferase|nr:aminomethyltransferase family protein [Pyrinomonadaceae bacterium]
MTDTAEQLTTRKLALDETHRRAGAVFDEREGYLLPASYGDAAAEYDAVRGGDGAGLIDLSARGRVEVAGKDAVQFLNGLITNDVKALAPGAWIDAAFPNPQGRLIAFARVWRATRDETFLFDTEPATRAAVFKNLERFSLAGDFRVSDTTDLTAQLSVQGARAGRVVADALGDDASAAVARGRVALSERRGVVAVSRATHTGEDGFDLVVGVERAAELWDALTASGARPVGQDALEVLRVEAGVARYGADVDASNVVLEAGLGEAVSYTKGCYVGQEIIARIHWRGHVAKKLAGLVPEGDDEGAALTPGAKLKAADASREIGRVTSVVFSPRLRKQIALGVVKYDFLAAGTEVLIEGERGGSRARVAELPFVRGGWHRGDASEAKS